MSLAGSNRKPALTAAASKIAYSKRAAEKIKEADWQQRAWQVYELEGSIYFMTRYRSAVARKVDYFAASVESSGDDPDRDAEYNDDGELISLGAAAKVLEVEGGPELIRRLVSELMVHWDVPGEGYLTRFEEEPFWRILSTQELKKSGAAYSWGDEDNKMGTITPDQVYRVWKAHPRFHWEADSPTKHVLEDAEELILLRRELKARSNSRLPAGVLLLPDSIDLSPFADDEDGTPDDIARWLTDLLAEAVRDPGSTRSLAPTIMTMHGDDIAKVRWLTFDREWDINLEQRSALLRSIATGLDVPPEILTGMADLNHWSAWLVSEQAVSQHVAPTVDDILDSLTTNWFKPLLEAAMVDPERYVLWRDLSPATVAPDVSDLSIRLFEQGIISDVTVRRNTNHDEADAPEIVEGQVAAMDADELLKRINAFGTLRRAGAEWEDAVRAVGLPPIEQIPGLLPITVRAEEVVKNEEAVVSAIDDLLGDPPLPGAAVTAAVRRRIVATELADLDAELLAWVQAQADLEIERLTKLALSAAVDPLDESMLNSLANRLEVKIAEAQAAARGWLSRTLGRTLSDDGESLARNQGVQVIIGGILEAVRRKLFTPGGAPDPIELGQIGNITTPTQAIRHGLSLAGGGPAVYEDGKAAELIGNGQHVHDELAEDGFFQDGYEWKYGHPANTFEPHLHLDGKQFTSWDDPQLAVNFGDSWLRRSHYAPGDHKGCCCAFIQVIVEQLPLSEGPGEGLAPGPEANIKSLDDLRAWAESNGLKLKIGGDVTAADLAGIRQAVKAIDDMRARFPILSGTWTTHPFDVTLGKRRGLLEVEFGTPGPFGAGASAKDLAGAGRLSVHDLNSARYLETGRIGQIVSQSAYDGTLHEIGHIMDYTVTLARTDPLKFRAAVRAARREVWGKLNVADDLSNYAASTEGNEFFAEVFAARNSNAIRGRLTAEALARVEQFARILNEKVHELGILEDVI